jgi:hypothetical protein
LLFLLFVIGNGTAILWRLADDGSWLTAASIAGHAFIRTGLMISLFVFYKYLLRQLPLEPPIQAGPAA